MADKKPISKKRVPRWTQARGAPRAKWHGIRSAEPQGHAAR